MNKTKELLWKIRTAAADGKLPVENIPIADIKQCVYSEIGVYQNTVTES